MERQVTNLLDHIDLSKQDLLLLVDVEKTVHVSGDVT